MSEWLIEFGQWFRQYQYGCAMAIIATILVIFGNEINAAVRQLVRKQHFFVRTSVFVLLCTLGYGVATVWLTRLLSEQLAKVPNIYIVPVVCVIFIALGAYAQRQKHI